MRIPLKVSLSDHSTQCLIGQINLGGGRISSLELLDVVSELNLNCVLGQEPYVHADSIGLLPKQTTCSTSGKTPKTFIHFKDCSNTLLIQELTCPEITVCNSRLCSHEIYFISVYFPPSQPIEPLLTKLSNVLNCLKDRKIIIAGDFNAKSNMWFSKANDVRGERVEEFILFYNLTIVNELSNHFSFMTANGCENIDLTLVSSNLSDYVTNWHIDLSITSSDHNLCVISISSHKDTVIKPCRVRYITDNQGYWRQFEISISKEIPELVALQLETEMDVDTYVDCLTSKLITSCDIALPRKRFHTKSRVCLPFKAKRLRRRINGLIRWISRHRTHPDFMLKKVECTAYRKEYRKIIWEARKFTFESMVNKFSTTPWGPVYSSLTKKATESFIRSIRTEEQKDSLDYSDNIMNILNHLLPDDDPSQDSPSQAEMRKLSGQPFNCPDGSDFSLEEVEGALKLLKKRKAPGRDNIPAEAVKVSGKYLAREYLRLFNACLRLGYFPRKWKIASVILLRKDQSKDPRSPKSYRPISLLSCLGKLLENMIATRLESHMTLSSRQYGFVKGRSTEDALNTVLRKCTQTTAQYSVLVALDISGAFDNAWWPSVSMRLRSQNVSRNVYNILDSFFHERYANYYTDEKLGKAVNLGVPQGSILGPKAWNYILDELLRTFNFEDMDLVAYADDTALIVNANSRRDLEMKANKALAYIFDWGVNNKLTFNTSKSECIFLKGDLSRHPILRLNENSQSIPFRNQIKYLGFTLDKGLTMIPHARAMISRRKTYSRNSEGSLRLIMVSSITVLRISTKVYLCRLSAIAVQSSYTLVDRVTLFA